MATTIYTYLHNDDLNGSRIVKMDDCMCMLYDIKRNDSSFMRDFNDDLQKPALYVLLNRASHKAYIGETDDFVKRIAQHLVKKEFWDEVLVFLGSNEDTLSKTEVQYLEYLAYNKALDLKRFDLSENTQSPKLPHMNVMLKGKTDKFFAYVQTLAQFVGCEIFTASSKRVSINHVPVAKSHNDKGPDKDLAEQLKGRVKLSLNGCGKYTKSMFVWQVIRTYLDQNPNTTFSELQEVFPQSLIYPWSGWKMLQPDLEFAMSPKYAQRYTRGEGCVLKTCDGIKFMVCNQWDSNNLWKVLDVVRQLGMTYQILR